MHVDRVSGMVALPGAAQIALSMLALIAALIALERYGRQRRSHRSGVQDPRTTERVALAGGWGWLATLTCLAPVALGFFVPAGFLLREAIRRGLVTGFDHDPLGHAATTAALAVCATIVVLVLGIATALPLRRCQAFSCARA
ncbi:MAG: hypothetical protein WB686_20190 [Pseudolabrys sp.]